MKAPALEIVLAIVAAIAIVVLAYVGQAGATPPAASIPSTYDTGRAGYRALFDVLRVAGAPVRRFQKVAAVLDPDVRTLVVTGYENDPPATRKPLDSQDVAVLARFVRDGGRLVEIDAAFAGKDDIAPSVGVSEPVARGTREVIPIARDRYTLGVERARGPIGAAFGFGSSAGVPLLANRYGIVATRSSYGKGEVIAVTAPALFSNAHLQEGDNATFAYDVIAGHGPIAFDEYVHGYDDSATLWQALPGAVRLALFVIGAIVLLALIGANVPFAPPVPLEPPDERDTSAYVHSMGALMRRARAGAAAIAAFGADARRCVRLNRTPDASDALAELDRLAALPHPSEAAILRAARIDFHLRKDVR